MKRFEGAFELTGTGISGFVSAREHKDPLWVEVLVDDCVMGITCADIPTPKGYGFWFALSPVALENGEEVRVRIANTTLFIGETLSLANAPNTPYLQGEIQRDRGLTLSGWALDSRNPEQFLRIQAFVDGESVAEALACARRSHTQQGDKHGFILHLPLALADGKEHVVMVQDEQKRNVPGSPLTICLWPESLADFFDTLSPKSASARTLFSSLLRRLETRVPGACAANGADFNAWKAAFPVPDSQKTQRFSLALPLSSPAKAETLLRHQKGINCKAQDNADYALILREGESLHPLALSHMVALQRKTGATLIYADSERASDGSPCFRPAWDEEFFWSKDYLGPFLVTGDVFAATPYREGESYPAFRVRLVQTASRKGALYHIPYLLSYDLPLPEESDRKDAVQAWVQALNAKAQVRSVSGQNRVLWPRTHLPSVTIIIPTKDHATLLCACLDSLRKTLYPSFDILIIDNGSTEDSALDLLKEAAKQKNTRVLAYPGPFNYAAINNFAACEATGELLCLLNNDTEVLTPDWLQEMASLLTGQGDAVGCVGAKLLWPNGLTQHAGVVIGTHSLASHIGNHWLEEDLGYLGCNQCVCQRSAVTAACLLTPKALFTELGGFDARRFPVTFNDVDYCLRVRAWGKKILWTPFARLLHCESASRGTDIKPMHKARAEREMRFFRQLWGTYEDPFYNANLPLSTVTEPYEGLAVPPRARHTH